MHKNENGLLTEFQLLKEFVRVWSIFGGIILVVRGVSIGGSNKVKAFLEQIAIHCRT